MFYIDALLCGKHSAYLDRLAGSIFWNEPVRMCIVFEVLSRLIDVIHSVQNSQIYMPVIIANLN